MMELMYSPVSAPCRAVLMCIEELGVKIELRQMDMQKKMEHMMAWFVRLNPQHTVPTLDDRGFILWESRAILQYLVSTQGGEKYDHLYPREDHQRRACIDRMLNFDLGTLNKSIDDYFRPVIACTGQPKEKRANALKQALDYLDRLLAGRYAVGDQLSVADFSLLATVSRLEAFNYHLETYQRLHSWSSHLKTSLPYYDRCNLRGIQMFREAVRR